MRAILAGILAAACGALQALATSKDSTYTSVHQELIDLAKKNDGVITLDTSTYEKITASNRDWSVTLQFTAMAPNMKCSPCREFAPNFNAVAKSWSKVEPKLRNQHFFAVLDFADATDVFRRLQLVSAPVLYSYPAARGDRRPANGKIDAKPFDFHEHGFDSESLAEELSKTTPTKIPYKPPFNWSLLTSVVMLILTLLLSIRLILPVLASRWTWAVAITLGIIVFTSGIMFVRIRGSPWAGRSKQGTSWLASGYQNQYGMEIQVMAGIYGTLAFSYVALIFLVPRILSPTKQRIAVYIWCCVILLLFSVLLSLFGVKNPAYPFRLLL